MDGEQHKQSSAQALIRSKSNCISTQVINEVCHNLVRKAHYTESEIRQTLAQFEKHTFVHQINIVDIDQASRLRETYRLSYWDSLIVATALASRCQTLYSEDMQHNQRIEFLTICNPFKS